MNRPTTVACVLSDGKTDVKGLRIHSVTHEVKMYANLENLVIFKPYCFIQCQ